MATHANLESAITALKALSVRAAADPVFRSVVEGKKEAIATHGPRFSPEQIPTLTERDFRSFLRFARSRHWGGVDRQGAKVCSDMDQLRAALLVLVDESRPIRDRLNELRPSHRQAVVLGLGTSVLTGILQITSPTRYGVWNRTSMSGIRALGVWPEFEQDAGFGEQYEAVNDVLCALANALDMDLWTLDALWWFALTDEDSPAAYLLTWNPRNWTWADLAENAAQVRAKGALTTSWSCGVSKKIRDGDRVFLIKLGPDTPRGLMASGHAVSDVYEAAHWSDSKKTARYIDVSFDALLDLDECDPLPRDRLDDPPLDQVHWSSQSSGIGIPDEVVPHLERIWAAYLDEINYRQTTATSAESVLTRLLQDSDLRHSVLLTFADAIEYAHQVAPDQWGVRLDRDGIVLTVGATDVCAVRRGCIWTHLVRERLSSVDVLILDRSPEWRWDVSPTDWPSGTTSPLVSGSYTPTDSDSDVALIAPVGSCQTIEWSVTQSRALSAKSRKAHAPDVLTYVGRYLVRPMPAPTWLRRDDPEPVDA